MEKCKIDDGRILVPCKALDAEIEHSSPSGRFKGIFAYTLTNMKTGQISRSGVGIKTAATPKGVLLNFCPWCGENIGKMWEAEGEA
jgi:hypothetical protein